VKTVEKWDQVPTFKTTEDERKFWLEHQLSTELMHSACMQSSGLESTTITIRIDPRMLARLKRLAGQRYLNYQSMLKQWVAERLERELNQKSD
jgi:predicted DNA binding CopG/RHH family protein